MHNIFAISPDVRERSKFTNQTTFLWPFTNLIGHIIKHDYQNKISMMKMSSSTHKLQNDVSNALNPCKCQFHSVILILSQFFWMRKEHTFFKSSCIRREKRLKWVLWTSLWTFNSEPPTPMKIWMRPKLQE